MAMDGQGNLYIEYFANASGLAVDRIPASMVQDLADGVTLAPPTGSNQILPANNVAVFGGNLRPQLAVGSDSTQPGNTAVYLFGGDFVFNGTPNIQMYAWEGSATDSFSFAGNPLWKTVDDNQHDVGGDFAPMTVGGDGTLYSTGSDHYVYALSASATTPTFTQLFAAPSSQEIAAAYTDGAGETTLFSLVTDANGRLNVASAPVAGAGSGTWAVLTVAPLASVDTSPANACLAVDPSNGQVSVLYEDTTTSTLEVVVATDGLWSRKVVSSGPISFGIPNHTSTYGNDRAQVDWYSVNNGKGAVAYMQVDPSISATPPSDVAELDVDLAPVAGENLVITNEGTGTNDQIRISRNSQSGYPDVWIKGNLQTYDTSLPVVNVIVNAQRGASILLDRSGGVPAIGGHFTLNGDNGDDNAVEISAGPSGSTDVARFTSTSAAQVQINDFIVNFSGLNAVTVDSSSGGSRAEVRESLPYALTLNGGSGANDLYVDPSGASLPAWTAIRFTGPTASTTLHVTGTVGDDTFTFSATSLALGNKALVTYDAGDINRLLIDSESGNDTLNVNAPLSAVDGAATFGGLSGNKSVYVTSAGGGLPYVSGDSVLFEIDSAGTFATLPAPDNVNPFTLTVNDGADVTLTRLPNLAGAFSPTLNIDNGKVTLVAWPSRVAEIDIAVVNVPAGGSGYLKSLPSADGSIPARLLNVTTANISGALTFDGGGQGRVLQIGNATVNGGSLRFVNAGYYAVTDTLSILNGGVVQSDTSSHWSRAGGTTGALLTQNTVYQLVISGGLLDLGNQSLTLTGGASLAGVVGAVVSAYGPAGDWQGTTGITSSVVSAAAANAIAAGDPPPFGIGFATDADNANDGGLVPTSGQIVILPTGAGDATMDGKVNIADLSNWNNNNNPLGGSDWVDGDFNYDGKVNIADLSVWNNSFGVKF